MLSCVLFLFIFIPDMFEYSTLYLNMFWIPSNTFLTAHCSLPLHQYSLRSITKGLVEWVRMLCSVFCPSLFIPSFLHPNLTVLIETTSSPPRSLKYRPEPNGRGRVHPPRPRLQPLQRPTGRGPLPSHRTEKARHGHQTGHQGHS